MESKWPDCSGSPTNKLVNTTALRDGIALSAVGTVEVAGHAGAVFGASIVPITLVIYGSLLAASSDELKNLVASDPIGALTTLLPTWYLIPFALVAILGLIGRPIYEGDPLENIQKIINSAK